MNEPNAAVRQPAGKPYVLDVRAFGRRPGTSAQVHRTVAAPERIGVDLIGIENGEEVDLGLVGEVVAVANPDRYGAHAPTP